MHASQNLFQPIPGTEPSPRALFVDRWGTLLERPEAGWCRTFREVTFVEGALDALFRACRNGWRIYLLGNEEQVAFGRQNDSDWNELEAGVLAALRGHGVAVTRNYVSVDHPEGVEGHQMDSVYHLPNTGAFYHAAHVDGVDLGRSWVVGDSTLELVAGWRAGVRQAAVRTGEALSDGRFEVTPELISDSLADVVTQLLRLEGAPVR